MIKTGGSNIFLAASYRSGGTHIATCLIKLLKMRMGRVSGFHGEGIEEQVVNPFSSSILMPYGGFLFHQHTRGTPMNRQLIQSFDNKLIVLTRNVLDTIVSLRDWLLAETTVVIPGLCVPRGFRKWDERAQYVWLAENVTPWSASFVYSWLGSDAYWIDYDEYYCDQLQGLLGLLSKYAIPCPDENLMKAIMNNRDSLRTGQSGRGRKLMPAGVEEIVENHIISWGPYAEEIRKRLLC